MNISFETDESIRDEILDHLRNKYNGQEFTALALERGRYRDTLYCFVQGGDPEGDNVTADRTVKDGAKVYSDTYFAIIIREDLEAEVLAVCSDIDIPMQAYALSTSQFYNNMWDCTKNYADLKQWIADGNPRRFDVTVVISVDNMENGEYFSKQIISAITESGYKGIVGVLAITDADVYSKITRSNQNDLIRQNRDSTKLFMESVN